MDAQFDLYLRGITMPQDPDEPWLQGLPAVCHLRAHGLSLSRRVTFLVGENGMGKSTLLEAIAVALGFNPEGGTKNLRFSTEDSHSSLHTCLRVVRGPRRQRDGFFLRAESFYNVASTIDQWDREAEEKAAGCGTSIVNSYGGISLHRQSHGESFISLVEHRFGGQGLYLLDEPESALSPMRQMTLLAHIHAITEQDSQFLIATHSPILMTYPNAEILLLSEDGIRSVSYRETKHYEITRRFLENPERMLRHLLESER